MTAELFTMLEQRFHECDPSGIYLRKGDKISLLGLICQIALEEGIIDPPVPAHDPKIYPGVMCYDGEACVLSHKVGKWAGLKDTRGFGLIGISLDDLRSDWETL